MDRRTFLAGTVAAASATPSGTAAAAADMGRTDEGEARDPALHYPMDAVMLSEIDHLFGQAARMKSALIAAQTPDPTLRDGYLFDLRSALGMLRLYEDIIGRRAWVQAAELNWRIYRQRRYDRLGRRYEAIIALRKAGWSWRDAAEMIVDEPAIALGIAQAMQEREEAGVTFPAAPTKADIPSGL